MSHFEATGYLIKYFETEVTVFPCLIPQEMERSSFTQFNFTSFSSKFDRRQIMTGIAVKKILFHWEIIGRQMN